MAKLKTIQAVAKRIRLTKNSKVMKKKCGQDHFNSREPGKVSRMKRRTTSLNKDHAVNVKRFIPWN